MPQLRQIPLWLLISVALTGCASERAKAADRKARQDQKDYVDYYPTGSNLPIKVRKEELAALESDSEKQQEMFRRAQSAGRSPEDGPQTGIPGAQGGGGNGK